MSKPKENKKYVPPVTVRMWAKFSGLCLISVGAMIYIAFVKASSTGEQIACLCMAPMFALGFLGFRILSKKAAFKGLKKYYIKNGIDKLIQTDVGDMSFSLKVYNSLPGKYMLKWITELNPAAGKVIAGQIKK